MEVIETNLSIDENNIIRDHRSRIVEIDSWSGYCSAYEKYRHDGVPVWFKPKLKTMGFTITRNCVISDLKYDDLHLLCDITRYNDNGEKVFVNKRLASLI